MSETKSSSLPQYKKKDFISDQEVRWCPGCGDYSILASVQMALAEIGKKREDIVFVSGIGCSSRFPYYINTFGMHTIHGRASAIASGLKIQNPNLSVWVATGDGDALAIGGNHIIHLLRRNLNINVIMFNNAIYGLTKGQYSPTTKHQEVTKSSPYGNPDRPFIPAALTLGAASTFYARTIDTDLSHMKEMMIAAAKHEGTSFIEVYQNCVIYSNKLHDPYTNRLTRENNTVRVNHGEPMIFGKNKDKGLILDGFTPKVVTIGEGEGEVSEDQLIIHDETDPNVANMLSYLHYPEFPVPLGIFRKVPSAVYDAEMNDQMERIIEEEGEGTLTELYHSNQSWEVK